MGLGELFWPNTIQWTTEAGNAGDAKGGYFIGISVLVFCIVSLIHTWKHRNIGSNINALFCASWLWLASGFALSIGSIFQSFAGPFLFYNAIMDQIARPLTQPTRYIMLCVVGFLCWLLLLPSNIQKFVIGLSVYYF